MVRVAFNVDYLRRDIFGAVANRVDQHTAAHGAVGTRRARFAGARDLQLFQLRISGLEVKPKNGGGTPASSGDLQEVPASSLHSISLQPFKHRANFGGGASAIPQGKDGQPSLTGMVDAKNLGPGAKWAKIKRY